MHYVLVLTPQDQGRNQSLLLLGGAGVEERAPVCRTRVGQCCCTCSPHKYVSLTRVGIATQYYAVLRSRGDREWGAYRRLLPERPDEPVETVPAISGGHPSPRKNQRRLAMTPYLASCRDTREMYAKFLIYPGGRSRYGPCYIRTKYAREKRKQQHR
jgi:hypothetical protein